LSDSFKGNPEVILILIAGWAATAVILFMLRKRGMKRYQYDERYYHITNHIKAKSWDTMLVVLLVAWLIVIVFDGISFSFFLMTGIVAIRSITQLVFSVYYSWNE